MMFKNSFRASCPYPFPSCPYPVTFFRDCGKFLFYPIVILLILFTPADISAYNVSSDFAYRDTLKQTASPNSDWFIPEWGIWGPPSLLLPKPEIPKNADPTQWKQERIVAAAKHYIGLPYHREDGMRGHFPDRGCGLDCSNFVAWVYNYGLGIRLSSDVDILLKDCKKKLELQKGDLVFYNTKPKHVMIYINENFLIDSTRNREDGVQVRDLRLSENTWCVPNPDNPYYLGGKRIINP